MPSDWLFNFDLTSGRVRCHGRGDIVRGKNRDWARVSGAKYIFQKMALYFAIPKGEVLNDPNVGCCLHNYIFDKNTDERLVVLEIEMTQELLDQIPELGLHKIDASRGITKDSIKLKIVGFNTWIFNVTRNDLIDISLVDVFGGVPT